MTDIAVFHSDGIHNALQFPGFLTFGHLTQCLTSYVHFVLQMHLKRHHINHTGDIKHIKYITVDIKAIKPGFRAFDGAKEHKLGGALTRCSRDNFLLNFCTENRPKYPKNENKKALEPMKNTDWFANSSRKERLKMDK